MFSEAAIVVGVVADGDRWKSALWRPFFHQEWALFLSQLLRPGKHVPLERVMATPKSCPPRFPQNHWACTHFLCLAVSYIPVKSHLCFLHAHPLSGFSCSFWIGTPFPTLPTWVVLTHIWRRSSDISLKAFPEFSGKIPESQIPFYICSSFPRDHIPFESRTVISVTPAKCPAHSVHSTQI